MKWNYEWMKEIFIISCFQWLNAKKFKKKKILDSSHNLYLLIQQQKLVRFNINSTLMMVIRLKFKHTAEIDVTFYNSKEVSKEDYIWF